MIYLELNDEQSKKLMRFLRSTGAEEVKLQRHYYNWNQNIN